MEIFIAAILQRTTTVTIELAGPMLETIIRSGAIPMTMTLLSGSLDSVELVDR